MLYARHCPPPQLSSIYAGSELIVATDHLAKNIGVYFDNTPSMNKQVNSLCKTAFYHLRNLATIRRFLSHKYSEILIHAFVISRIDYSNSLLSGVPQFLLQKLQYVQNAAVRLLTYSKTTTFPRFWKNYIGWLSSQGLSLNILILTSERITKLDLNIYHTL